MFKIYNVFGTEYKFGELACTLLRHGRIYAHTPLKYMHTRIVGNFGVVHNLAIW